MALTTDGRKSLGPQHAGPFLHLAHAVRSRILSSDPDHSEMHCTAPALCPTGLPLTLSHPPSQGLRCQATKQMALHTTQRQAYPCSSLPLQGPGEEERGAWRALASTTESSASPHPPCGLHFLTRLRRGTVVTVHVYGRPFLQLWE